MPVAILLEGCSSSAWAAPPRAAAGRDGWPDPPSLEEGDALVVQEANSCGRHKHAYQMLALEAYWEECKMVKGKKGETKAMPLARPSGPFFLQGELGMFVVAGRSPGLGKRVQCPGAFVLNAKNSKSSSKNSKSSRWSSERTASLCLLLGEPNEYETDRVEEVRVQLEGENEAGPKYA
mmetsp:Transcript_36828/g.49972  ORF Transcript_36828/g.49972 Transcript_36828/m.49972 type:complete len:178 (-) Transcript_36828:187-720(-)